MAAMRDFCASSNIGTVSGTRGGPYAGRWRLVADEVLGAFQGTKEQPGNGEKYRECEERSGER